MHAILLTGAALVGLPVLLHLIMKQEPKRLLFPAYRFLKQKLKTNQRKLRLRHVLLLALRMLLIALFCLALYQPTLKSDRLNIRGEQPVATVIVIDTSPSMGYTTNDKTRLAEACRRALELLDELPEKSPVVVVATDEPAGYWQDVAEARRQIERLDKPRGGPQPLTTALALAYQLLTGIDAPEADDPSQLPKLVAVFTDRTAACWDATRVEELKKLRETIPGPKPTQLVVDVGADQPLNVGLLAAEMKPQVIAANQAAGVTVTVAATGPAELPPVEAVVLARLNGSSPERRLVTVPQGQSRTVNFEFRNLKPGIQQVEFALETPDKLLADNTRYLTFRVAEARRILTISDDPESAAFWQMAHAAKKEFDCLVVRPDDVTTGEGGRTEVRYPHPEKPGETLKQDLSNFEVVTLLAVAEPDKPSGNSLWDKLRPYVEAGGKLLIVPGPDLSPDSYKAGGNLMPAEFVRVIDTRSLQPPPPRQTAPGWDTPRDGANGVTWAIFDNERVLQHPMLRPFQEWKARPNVDAVKYPRLTWKYWELKPDPTATVIVRYNDAEKEADRRPAVIERNVGGESRGGEPRGGESRGRDGPEAPEAVRGRGRVLLLSTRLDVPSEEQPAWNNYWELEGSSWYVVFPWLVTRYLAGDTADANFNFPVGQVVVVPLPRGAPRGTRVLIDNPTVVGNDALIELGEKQTELRLGPPRINQPGNYLLTAPAVRWRDGFSLNIPVEESNLEKVPVAGIEELTGAGSVVPVGKDVRLRDVIPLVLDQPIDLFPWLLIAVLILLAVEGLLASHFYGPKR